ncbi:MAG TPA: PEGA domain-containing protein [Trebonia sp.]|nr:PEGA domain-containing protein [Trebonia sp.]
MVAAATLPPAFARAAGADEAEKLIRHGIELRKAHDDEGAARAFQQAYDQIHTPRAAAQLGLAEQALGRWEDAERHVSEAVHASGDNWIAKNRPTLEDALGTIEAHLGRIEVLGDPEGAEVSVNGRSVGKLPLAEAVRVSAGEVEVEMHAPGYVGAQRNLTIVGGQYQRLVLHLAKETPTETATPVVKPSGGEGAVAGPGTTTTPVVTTPAAEPPSQTRMILKWSAAGAAVLGLGVGVTFAILHASNVSDFNDNPAECHDNNGKAVLGNGDPAPPACQSALDAYRSDTTYSIIGFAGAGVFAATWLVLQLTEGPSHAGADHALRNPWCAPSLSGRGFSCQLRF